MIIEPNDLEKVRLPSTKAIDIDGFIDASEMDPTLYEGPISLARMALWLPNLMACSAKV